MYQSLSTARLIVTVCWPLALGLSAEAVTLTTESDFLPWAATGWGRAASSRPASSAPEQHRLRGEIRSNMCVFLLGWDRQKKPVGLRSGAGYNPPGQFYTWAKGPTMRT